MSSNGEATIFHVYKLSYDWINDDRTYLRSHATREAAEDWINEQRLKNDDWGGYQIVEEKVSCTT